MIALGIEALASVSRFQAHMRHTQRGRRDARDSHIHGQNRKITSKESKASRGRKNKFKNNNKLKKVPPTKQKAKCFLIEGTENSDDRSAEVLGSNPENRTGHLAARWPESDGGG